MNMKKTRIECWRKIWEKFQWVTSMCRIYELCNRYGCRKKNCQSKVIYLPLQNGKMLHNLFNVKLPLANFKIAQFLQSVPCWHQYTIGRELNVFSLVKWEQIPCIDPSLKTEEFASWVQILLSSVVFTSLQMPLRKAGKLFVLNPTMD